MLNYAARLILLIVQSIDISFYVFVHIEWVMVMYQFKIIYCFLTRHNNERRYDIAIRDNTSSKVVEHLIVFIVLIYFCVVFLGWNAKQYKFTWHMSKCDTLWAFGTKNLLAIHCQKFLIIFDNNCRYPTTPLCYISAQVFSITRTYLWVPYLRLMWAWGIFIVFGLTLKVEKMDNSSISLGLVILCLFSYILTMNFTLTLK